MHNVKNRLHAVIDCHCDTVYFFDQEYQFNKLNPERHIDLPRLLGGGVTVQFFAVCVATERHRGLYLRDALHYINLYHRCLEQNREHLQRLETLADLAGPEESRKINCLLALEGAEPLEGSLELLEIFFRLGVRCLSLTWNNRNCFADGCSEEDAGGGLTKLGRRLVSFLSELGIILDLAHISSRGFSDALELSARPPLVSHANARRLCDHPRNLTDLQLKALAEKGGVVGLSFYPPFITGEKRAGLEQLVDHFCHVADTAGVEHLAIGSDFDGITSAVDELADASCHGLLIEALSRRGFQDREVELIAGGNIQRLLELNLPAGDQR